MDKQEFAAWDKRVAERAHDLWIAAGRPEGPRDHFTDAARQLIAIAENPDAGQVDPQKEAEPVIEEASLLENLGEQTSFSDRQGEEAPFPHSGGDRR